MLLSALLEKESGLALDITAKGTGNILMVLSITDPLFGLFRNNVWALLLNEPKDH